MKLCDLYEGKLRRTEADASCFEQTYDIIVAGMGVAGVCAALTAARKGLKVLGIEQLNIMGGTGTAGGIWSYYKGNRGGIYLEIDALANRLFKEELESSGCDAHKRYGGQCGLYKAMASRMLCEEAGVITYYGMTATGVYTEENRVVGIRAFDGENRSFGAKYVIDCTADGSVCMAAGCEMMTGRESDSSFQPYSNIMVSYRNGGLRFENTDSGSLDQYDPFEYGWAALYSATTPMFLPDEFIKEKRFIGLAPLLGMRQGKTIVGEESVSLAGLLDSLAYGEKGNTAFYAMSHVDDHSQDFAYGDVAYCELMSVTGLWMQDFTFAIPTGAMIPRGYDGLLAAGRMVSVDHNLAQAMRMKDDMQKSGEAAAAIAITALESGCRSVEIDVERVRKLLRETGCLCEGEHELFRDTPDNAYFRDEQAIEAGFCTDQPGQYIMSSRYMPDGFADRLAEWLDSDNVRLRNNAALALSLRRDARAAFVLLDMLKDRSGYTPKGYYVPNQALAAATSCGLMGVREAVPILFEYLEPHFSDGIPFVQSWLVQDSAALAFEYFTYAHMALLRIAKANPDIGSDIIKRLDEIIYASDFMVGVNIRAADAILDDRTEVTRKVHERFKSNMQQHYPI